MAYNETAISSTANQTSVSLVAQGIQVALVNIPQVTSISFDSGSNFLGAYVQKGTFTPTVTGAAVSGTITYSVQQGTYVRIGYLCVFYLGVAYTAIGTSSGTLQILGLPFNPKNLGVANTPCFSCHTGNVAFDAGYTNFSAAYSGTTNILNIMETGTTKALQAINIPSGSKSYWICGKYIIDGA